MRQLFLTVALAVLPTASFPPPLLAESLPLTPGPSCVQSTAVPAPKHALTLTPEVTLRTMLDGYVRRDLETVAAYLHPTLRDKPEMRQRFIDAIRANMSPERHVSRVVSITLVRVRASGDKEYADLVSIIEASSRFSGRAGNQSNERQHNWTLVRFRQNGPWYHSGGGF